MPDRCTLRGAQGAAARPGAEAGARGLAEAARQKAGGAPRDPSQLGGACVALVALGAGRARRASRR